ncbi:hypothetical protein DAI22_02g036400 [Oryza sativa Japonica Group]|nr:hypothetical protein DAI22_02g036400 [Oryza sativa Japonica Group]
MLCIPSLFELGHGGVTGISGLAVLEQYTRSCCRWSWTAFSGICGMQAAAETATEHVRFQLRSASCMGRFTFHSYRFMHCSAPNIFLYSRGLADVRTGMGRSGFIYFVARYSL